MVFRIITGVVAGVVTGVVARVVAGGDEEGGSRKRG
jgi:hypothetical protein